MPRREQRREAVFLAVLTVLVLCWASATLAEAAYQSARWPLVGLGLAVTLVHAFVLGLLLERGRWKRALGRLLHGQAAGGRLPLRGPTGRAPGARARLRSGQAFYQEYAQEEDDDGDGEDGAGH